MEKLNDTLLQDLAANRKKYSEALKTNRYLRKKNLKQERKIKVQEAELRQAAEYFNDLKEENFKLNTVLLGLDESEKQRMKKSMQCFFEQKKKIRNLAEEGEEQGVGEFAKQFLNNDDILEISIELQEQGVNTSVDVEDAKVMVD